MTAYLIVWLDRDGRVQIMDDLADRREADARAKLWLDTGHAREVLAVCSAADFRAAMTGFAR